MKTRHTLIATAVSLALMSPAMAGEIQSINTFNFGLVTDPAVPAMPIYDRAATEAGAITYGVMGWDVLKAVEPGIAVYNNVPAYGTSQIIADCVMAPRLPALAGDPDKACNDGFQTHKRYKMSATGVGPIEVVFKVKNTTDAVATIYDKDGNVVATDQDTLRNIYRMIGKLNNHTNGRLGGFKVELGFGLGAGFVKSTAGDGLKIGLHEEGADSTSDLKDDEMAEFPGGLFYGPADTKHDWGFFSSERANFTVNTSAIATDEDSFISGALSSNYSDLFGEWLPIDWVPTGWFYDHDGNPATDAVVTAWNDGTQWIQYVITDDVTGTRSTVYPDAAQITAWGAQPPTIWNDDGDAPKIADTDPDQTLGGTLFATWDAGNGVYIMADGSGTKTNDEIQALIDASTTLERRPGYQQGPIEDLANVNLNYFVEVENVTGSALPAAAGYDVTNDEYSFTLRITPQAAVNNDVPAWVPPAPTVTPAPTTSSGGGGCVSTPNAPFSPTMPLLTLAALGGLFWRLRRKQAH